MTAGELIAHRISGEDLRGTPLGTLPAFAARLLRATRRKRRDADGTLTIWELPAAEALAGAHYLGLYFHLLVPDDWLTLQQAAAVRAVCLALASQHVLARRGPDRMPRAEAERRLNAAIDDDPPDERWQRRLAARARVQDGRNRLPVNTIPPRLRRLLEPR